MLKKISKFFNLRVILLIASIVIFVLLNSTQESYVQVSDLTSTTLLTTDFGTINTTITNEETPTGPSFPDYTPPDTSDNGNGILNPDDRSAIPSQIIPVIIGSAIVIFIVVLLIQQRNSNRKAGFFRPRERAPTTSIKKKREKFRTHISTLMEILHEYLNKGKYAEGIIFGYHQLDSNMKKILGIMRETYLTPKEFSQSMDLPEIVEPLTKIIDIFYLARYRISEMKQEDLKNFIEHLQTLKAMSEFDSDIKIVRTEYFGDEE